MFNIRTCFVFVDISVLKMYYLHNPPKAAHIFILFFYC